LQTCIAPILAQFERGERNISIDSMERIASALRVSVITLLKDGGT